jgi:hypothetical protein
MFNLRSSKLNLRLIQLKVFGQISYCDTARTKGCMYSNIRKVQA